MIGNVASDILIALLVLGVIIVIHELGHFLVAKFFKIRVETFSVGMGPRVIGFRRGETDYRISAFPIGGYVKMSGENPGDTVTGDPHEFLSKPKWQRFLVASAGPAMNIFLAIGLLTGLYVYGTEVPDISGNAVVGIVRPDSPAAQIGLQPGDVILALNGRDRPAWIDVEAMIVTNPDRALPLTIERSGERIDTTITPQRSGPSETGYAGMFPAMRFLVRRVQPGSPAEAAGVLPGDEIIGVKGTDLRNSGQSIQEVIQAAPEQTFPITVLRKNEQTQATEEIQLQVTPIMQDGRRMIGFEYSYPTRLIKLGPAAAFRQALETNANYAMLIFDVLGKLVTRDLSLKSVDGPIGIVRVSGQALDLGLGTLITTAAMISLNLGLINLLPIPILDGGVMLLLMIEGLFRRDISLRMKERIVQVSFVFLLMLTVFVLYNDVVKLFPSNMQAP
jgi:regulator of sigma E protease